MIGSNPGVSQIAISNQLGTDRATIMSIVDRLEERTLVIRKRSKVDRRRHELYLTPKGKTTLAKALRRIDEHERRFTSRFTEKELAAFMEGLRRIHGQG